MKTYSDQLYALIKAMEPKEKLFFKVFGISKKRSKRAYTILFDALNGMKEYDETLLRKKLKSKGFAYNIDKAKSYLTKMILKSLTEYHSTDLIDAEIHDLIIQAEILYKKDLSKMAASVLDKAEKKSLEFEKMEYLILIYSLKANLALDISDLELKNFVNVGMKEQRKYLDMFINEINYRDLAMEIGVANRSPEVHTGNEIENKRLRKLFNDPLLKDKRSAITFSAKKYFYKIKYHHLVNQNKRSEEIIGMFKEWVEYFDDNADIRNAFPEEYLKALNNLLVASYSDGKTKEIEIIFAKAMKFHKSLSRTSKNYSIKEAGEIFVLTNFINAQLEWLNPEKGIQAYIDMGCPELTFVGYFVLSVSYLLVGKYHEALLSVNKVIDEKSEYRKDAQMLSRLLILIIHYELKNTEMLPYIAKRSRRWLVNNNYPLTNFDKMFVDFFEYKLPKCNSSKEELDELTQLLANLNQNKDAEKSILQKEIDLVSWLESKIQNRKLLEILRKKRAVEQMRYPT